MRKASGRPNDESLDSDGLGLGSDRTAGSDLARRPRQHPPRHRGSFVNRVAAPARGRGLGRWRSVCPGVANLDREVAQAIVDRIAETAAGLGVEVEDPGCDPNLIVVFGSDARALAQAMVEANPRVYRHGGNGIDQGSAALRRFLESERPVRWWLLNVPIDSDTGRRAVRVPGDASGAIVDDNLAEIIGCNPQDCVIGAAPIIRPTASRLNTQIVDHIYKAIVIVDIDAAAGLSAIQLGDYLSLVSLAQIDPEAEVGGFDTVLNLFEARNEIQGLTDWDQSYLEALYGSYSRRRSIGAQAGAVAAIMNRDTVGLDGE
jgi:hypothetical protein